MSKYYNILLAYVEDESKVGSIKYVKQILNQELEYNGTSNIYETKIEFPKDIIPGSESVFIDGVFCEPFEYSLETGIYQNHILDSAYISYSVLLDQEEGKADTKDMPILSTIELNNPEEELEEELVSPNLAEEI